MRALLQLRGFLKPYWHWATFAPMLMMMVVTLDLMLPRLVQRIIDQGIAHSDLSVVFQTVFWMAGILSVSVLGGAGGVFFAIRAAYGMTGDLRSALFRKVLMLSFGDLENNGTGTLITRLTSDVNQVQEIVTLMLGIMVRMPILLIGSIVMAVLASPKLGIIFLMILPILVIALTIISRKTFPLYRQVQRQLDAVNTILQENLWGVRVVKAFARSAHESRRFAEANNTLVLQTTDVMRMGTRITPIMMLTLNTGIVAVLWMGGFQVSAGRMHIGEIVAFINYLAMALFSLMFLGNLIIRISSAEASAGRIVALLHRSSEMKKPTQRLRQSIPEGRIAFEKVSFSYSVARHDPVLKNVSFVAEPGQTVALLGATGAGKSSLVQLIPHFYDVTEGRVTLDGVDVRELHEEELRRHVGIAMQESILFSGTVRNNICMGEPDAPFEKILAAAKLAQADEFIRRLPEGYETVVGQRGVNFSGGQKQRLAIARGLLPRTPIMILDDSTSAVDRRTEARIHEALAAQNFRQTRFIVAQRISTVLNADKILVLDDGQIVGEGTHPGLLDSCLIYREIYESQTEDGILIHGGD